MEHNYRGTVSLDPESLFVPVNNSASYFTPSICAADIPTTFSHFLLLQRENFMKLVFLSSSELYN